MSVDGNNNEPILSICIIESKLDKFQMNSLYSIEIKERLGLGSYGSAYNMGDSLVIKIFFNSVLGKTFLEERNCTIPYKNENRELSLYFRMIKDNLENHVQNHLIPPLAIGYTCNDINIGKDNFKRNTYFVILPYCIPF